jgi:2'-hydroxyisoflavone reductase
VNILIIGGSEFLGRYLTEASLARRHAVALFNRGKSNADLFPHVEKLRGDRNENLDALAGRRWDAVIDTCGYTSQAVRATAGLLSNAAQHYTFISSMSVYAGFDAPRQNESAPVQELAAGQAEDENDVATYGARKALAERAAEQAMPGRVLAVRAGLIVGPHDYMARFPYWVSRMARGGEVLAPAPPQRLVQLIDVRDLADWIVRMIERQQTGIFNATGPDYELTMEAMLTACRSISGSDARITWVDEAFLLERGVKPWSELPLWLPGKQGQNFFTMDCAKAFDAGLHVRPLEDTARDTLDWIRTTGGARLDASRPLVAASGQTGLLPGQERELLEAWHAKVAASV